MTLSPTATLIHHLRRRVLAPDAVGLTDGQLLTGFLERREEKAFAALVQRHGPMVWGVCRRLLGSHHDAEDAFQATFLVLVRKAATVRPREMVANFLHGVACTTALRARVAMARRRRKERQVAERPQPDTVRPEVWRDLQAMLDQEMSRLPDKYRIVLLLCDLEGKTRKEVARQLGCPEGTVAGRLARARDMMARRLARQGLAVSGSVLATALGRAAGCVPTSVVSSTLKAASLLTAAQAASLGAISVEVASLTQGVLRSMMLAKWKLGSVLLVVGVLGLGAGVLSYRAVAGQDPDQPTKPTPGKSQAAEPTQGAPAATRNLETQTPQEPEKEVTEAKAASDPITAPFAFRGQLPVGPAPTQALAQLDREGRLLVRAQTSVYEPETIIVKGQPVTRFKRIDMATTQSYPSEAVQAVDASGKTIEPKDLPRRLRKETPVLISRVPVDPLHLRLVKEETLIFVLPPPLASNPPAPPYPVPVPNVISPSGPPPAAVDPKNSGEGSSPNRDKP